jgi:2-polyprenyl-6-hydroxyphenyl methylase/3-demethylubiquinone-9 3-methyltransferase
MIPHDGLFRHRKKTQKSLRYWQLAGARTRPAADSSKHAVDASVAVTAKRARGSCATAAANEVKLVDNASAMGSQRHEKMQDHNVDPGEVAKFDALAQRWWDPTGEFGPLHDINPLRVNYIDERAPLKGARVADIGCGGGLLSEAMAQRGAEVVGVDQSQEALRVARDHADGSGMAIEYQHTTAEALAREQAGQFDTVACLEMLEHVPDPASVVAACRKLLKPGGRAFFATINRNPRAYLMAIVGAEYLLRLLPRGTHDYRGFIKPSELDEFARSAGLELEHLTGLHYNPLTRAYSLGHDVNVNYMMCCSAVDVPA